jgi:hypothetical protein
MTQAITKQLVVVGNQDFHGFVTKLHGVPPFRQIAHLAPPPLGYRIALSEANRFLRLRSISSIPRHTKILLVLNFSRANDESHQLRAAN